MRTILNSRRARWAVPVAIVATAGTIAGGVALAGESNPELPDKDAAELLTDLQNAGVEPFSGTVVQTSRLGLPEVPGLTDHTADVSLLSMLTGSNTARIWFSSAEQFRFSLMGSFDEVTLIRDGQDVWLWSSDTNEAQHLVLPENLPFPAMSEDGVTAPPDPHIAVQELLDEIDPSTEVTVSGTVEVAGRPAYELAVRPRDDRTLIEEVAIAIDGETSRVLRVEVLTTGSTDPAFEIGFTSVSFSDPSDEVYRFNPPPGADVTDYHLGDLMRLFMQLDKSGLDAAEQSAAPEVVGEGWTSVLVLRDVDVPADDPDGAGGADPGDDAVLDALLGAGEEVSGPYGSGRLFTTSLLSALWLDDGTVLLGAVTPDVLEEAAAQAS
jgi:outer membrane lipoprotein-sorting protein